MGRSCFNEDLKIDTCVLFSNKKIKKGDLPHQIIRGDINHISECSINSNKNSQICDTGFTKKDQTVSCKPALDPSYTWSDVQPDCGRLPNMENFE